MQPELAEDPPEFLTTREACELLGYSRPDSFLRAWRASGLPLYRRGTGFYLIACDDVGKFLTAAA